MAKGSISFSKAVPEKMWWECADSSLWNEEFQKLVCNAALEADSSEPNSDSSVGSFSSTMGSRAFISETTATAEEGSSGKKVKSGVKQNHWALYEMLWNYCAITRAFLSMKKSMAGKKPHLQEIVNKANSLEAAMKQMFERLKKRGKSAPRLDAWDPTVALRCAGLEGGDAEIEMKFFNQSCVDVVKMLEDKEKVVEVLDYLIETVACSSLRCKLQLVLSVFLNYNAAEKTVRKEFISAIVKKTRCRTNTAVVKRSAESKQRSSSRSRSIIVLMDDTSISPDIRSESIM